MYLSELTEGQSVSRLSQTWFPLVNSNSPKSWSFLTWKSLDSKLWKHNHRQDHKVVTILRPQSSGSRAYKVSITIIIAIIIIIVITRLIPQSSDSRAYKVSKPHQEVRHLNIKKELYTYFKSRIRLLLQELSALALIKHKYCYNIDEGIDINIDTSAEKT